MPPKAKKSKKEIEEEKSKYRPHSLILSVNRETRGGEAHSGGARKEETRGGRASEEDRRGEEAR